MGVFLLHILHTSASSLPLDFLIPVPSEFFGGLPFCGHLLNPVLPFEYHHKGNPAEKVPFSVPEKQHFQYH